MDAILDTVPPTLQFLFHEAAPRLARQTGFTKRLRLLQPASLAHTLSFGLIQQPNASLAQLASQLDITSSALHQRLSDPTAPEFLHALLRETLTHLAQAAASRLPLPLLRRFEGIYLVDGTILKLPAALADRFPGFGGGTHPGDPSAASAAKVLLRWRLDTSQATELLLDAATTADLKLLKQLPDLPAGSLHLADLGFFDAEMLQDYSVRGVFWLTRLPTTICVGTERADTPLADWLANLGRHCEGFEGELWLGLVTSIRARVMVQRCPQEVADRRRQHLRDRMRRKGRPVSQRQLILCDWWVLATNVPAERLKAAEAWNLYRARWQIELVFKRWKSLGHLHVEPRLEANRALATLYGLLVGVLVVDWLAMQRGGALCGRSLWRGWQVVRELLECIVLALRGELNWSFVMGELRDGLERRPRQARRKKHPSTRQRLFQATIRS